MNSYKDLHMMDLQKSISSQKQIDYLKQLLAQPKKGDNNAISDETSVQRTAKRTTT